MRPPPGAHKLVEATSGAEGRTRVSQPHDAPLVFLVGPPGSGKSVLGRRVCTPLGLRFVDLVDDGSTDAVLQELVRARSADVVTLPWAPARDVHWLDLCRRSGETVALWAHPLDMQARSGHSESLFTPVKRLRTRGGFGRSGTGGSEYRHLERTCGHVLLLVGLSEEIAAQELKALVDDLRSPEELSPAERERLLGWCGNWRDDFNADVRACEILVDAMARFTMYRKARGTSPRTMSGIYRDLNAAGFLVMCCDAPKGKDVLDSFGSGPSKYEFRRKISDSPHALARFRSTCDAFGRFLRDSGMLDAGGGELR
jgi:hypothetical protein